MQEYKDKFHSVAAAVHANKGVHRVIKFHNKRNCCCWCLTTKRGVQVIGVGIILSLIEELSAPNIVRIVLKALAIVPWIMMQCHDTAFNRQLFLWFFCLGIPGMFITNLIMYQNILADNVAYAGLVCWLSQKGAGDSDDKNKKEREESECNQKDDDERAECEADQDQCPVLPGGVLKVLIVITPLVILLNIHFAFVVYTHWKNSRLHRKDGGAQYGDGLDDD